MSVRIRYMGNKREMADDVAAVVDGLKPGRPVLDMFCGMCSVAGALAGSGRRVWVNDVQRYATLAARCLLVADAPPPDPTALSSLLEAAVERNRMPLLERFADHLAAEDAVLAEPTVDAYAAAYGRFRHAANDDGIAREVAEMAAAPGRVPYRLATLTFAWGYLGLRQSIELDSLRYAIETRRRSGELSATERQWALLALVQAASRMATGSGHMAQYLHAANPSSLARVMMLRRRATLTQFETELGLLGPYGDEDWRAGNVVLESDVLAIWPKLRRRNFRDAVVYADPPYSKNQYSRFYHVLETLARYDYPPAAGRGRYRPDRFITPFSTRRGVAASFDQLARGVAATGSTLVLSYPSQGMLSAWTDENVETILSRHFASVSVVIRRPARHSTLGARHGDASGPVEELVYVADDRAARPRASASGGRIDDRAAVSVERPRVIADADRAPTPAS